ncbi:MAG: outer membrane protein assembly factor BamD [Alphaproteobacteria bacterium]|nr:outer membrane protein assembly factor BamD [Alphaproteobacteria bacterium]
MKKLLAILQCVVLLFLTSCASTSSESIINDEDKSAETLYNEAYDLLEKTSYQRAAETFDKVEMEHPYSKWATKSKLMSAYSYYKGEKYDDAIATLDRFIRLHPGNKDISYAYYLKAVSFYDQISSSQKEQSATKEAYDTFMQIITMFPDTEYAKDAKNKMILIEDHLAGHEMEIGRYYLENKEYISALNRFSTVSDNYQTTAQIEEALYREVEVYTILGLDNEAEKKEKILSSNYPESKWSKMAKSLTTKE